MKADDPARRGGSPGPGPRATLARDAGRRALVPFHISERTRVELARPRLYSHGRSPARAHPRELCASPRPDLRPLTRARSYLHSARDRVTPPRQRSGGDGRRALLGRSRQPQRNEAGRNAIGGPHAAPAAGHRPPGRRSCRRTRPVGARSGTPRTGRLRRSTRSSVEPEFPRSGASCQRVRWSRPVPCQGAVWVLNARSSPMNSPVT